MGSSWTVSAVSRLQPGPTVWPQPRVRGSLSWGAQPMAEGGWCPWPLCRALWRPGCPRGLLQLPAEPPGWAALGRVCGGCLPCPASPAQPVSVPGRERGFLGPLAGRPFRAVLADPGAGPPAINSASSQHPWASPFPTAPFPGSSAWPAASPGVGPSTGSLPSGSSPALTAPTCVSASFIGTSSPTSAPAPLVPGWGIALLVLVCIGLVLSILLFILLVSAPRCPSLRPQAPPASLLLPA